MKCETCSRLPAGKLCLPCALDKLRLELVKAHAALLAIRDDEQADPKSRRRAREALEWSGLT